MSVIGKGYGQDLFRPSVAGVSRTGFSDRTSYSRYQPAVVSPSTFNQGSLGTYYQGPLGTSTPQNVFAPAPEPEVQPDGPSVSPEEYRVKGPKENYNFRVGPVYFRFGAGLRAEYNDNLGITAGEKISDFSTTPQIYLTGHWPISKINDLSLRMGIGYTAYLEHSELNSFSRSFELAPGTALSFKAKIGDVFLEVHDRPAVEHDPAEAFTLRGLFTYDRFSNNAGIGALLDLNNVVLKIGYERYDTIPLTDDFKQLQRASDSIFGSATLRITDTTSAGVEAVASLITYKEDFQNDATSYHAGVFVETQLTRAIRLQAAVGYQGAAFDQGGGNQDSSDLSSYYWNVSASHRLNRFITQSLSVGHEATLGTNSNFVSTDFIRHHVQWNVFNRITLGTDVFADFAKESGGIASQDFTSFGFVLSAGYTLTQHCSLEAFYSYQVRNASGGDDRDDQRFARDYRQNRVGVNIVYAF